MLPVTDRSALVSAVLALSPGSAVIDPSTNETFLGGEIQRRLAPHKSGVRKYLPDFV
jgi:hypothetical protein